MQISRAQGFYFSKMVLLCGPGSCCLYLKAFRAFSTFLIFFNLLACIVHWTTLDGPDGLG